jgi:hypothetical protein
MECVNLTSVNQIVLSLVSGEKHVHSSNGMSEKREKKNSF